MPYIQQVSKLKTAESCALQWIMGTKYQAAGMSHIIDDSYFMGSGGSN